MRAHRRRLPVLLLVAALAAAACGGASEPGSGDEPDASDGTAAAQVAEEFAYDEVHAAAEHMEVWALELTAAIVEAEGVPGDPHTKAAEMLATFDFLFREHSVLVAYATDVNLDAGQDVPAFIAAADQVEENTAALREQFFTAYDAETADEFARMWKTQVEQYYRYAEGVRLGDEQAKQAAREELETFVTGFGTFIEDVTAGEVEAKKIEEVTKTHVDALTATIEAQKDEGENWFERLKRAVDQSKTLAEEIAAPVADRLRLDGSTHSEAAKLRADLSGRMAETAFFIGYATRGILNEEETQFEQARALVDDNTTELGETLAKHLPDDAVRRVEELWAEHNTLFVDYTRAVAEGDEDRQQEVLDSLATWTTDLAEVLAEATDEHMTADAVEHEAAGHVETVQTMIDEQAKAVGT